MQLCFNPDFLYYFFLNSDLHVISNQPKTKGLDYLVNNTVFVYEMRLSIENIQD